MMLSLVQILCISWTLNSSKPCLRKNTVVISIVTMLYLMSWQFAQFTLFTQVAILCGLHFLDLIPRKETVEASLQGLLVSFENSSYINKIYLDALHIQSSLKGAFLPTFSQSF